MIRYNQSVTDFPSEDPARMSIDSEGYERVLVSTIDSLDLVIDWVDT